MGTKGRKKEEEEGAAGIDKDSSRKAHGKSINNLFAFIHTCKNMPKSPKDTLGTAPPLLFSSRDRSKTIPL